MEEQEKDILDRNYHLLVHNIILTEEFYNQLRWNQVLPDSMIDDIQACKTTEDRTKRLLYTLKLRGCDALRKLRHVLHITGHNFLADHLYEEDNEISIIQASDIFNKFPSIFVQVSDETKSKFIRYLETKIKEKSLAKCWNRYPTERFEVLENKKTSFSQERELRVKLDNKRTQVSTLKNELTALEEKVKKKELEIEALERERDGARKRYKAELSVQARFNAANNSSILRLREKFVSFNEKIKSLNSVIEQFLSGNQSEYDYDQENVKMSRLEENVHTILDLVKEQQDAVDSKAAERETILTLLKKSTNNNEPLSDIVKRHLERDEKAKSIVNKEIEKLVDILRKPAKQQIRNKQNPGIDMKHLRNMVATVRVEVEHLKKKLDWKDDQITDLIKETMMLRQTQTQTNQVMSENKENKTSKGAIVISSPVSSPDSMYQMELAYKNYNEYIASNSTLPNRNRRRGSLADVDLVEPDQEEIDNSFMDKTDNRLPAETRVKFPEVDSVYTNKSDTGSKKSTWRLSSITDSELAKILQTDNNVEFERLTSHIASKTQPKKLPLICKDAVSVDF